MSKTSATLATLAACIGACAVLALPALAARGDDGPTVATKLSVKYKEADADDPYGQSVFKGTVGPKKCAKKRVVTVSKYGKEKTDRKGKFEFELDGPADPGRYRIKVAEKGDCSKVKATLRIRRN